jgi:hypothetical protein
MSSLHWNVTAFALLCVVLVLVLKFDGATAFALALSAVNSLKRS